MSYYFVIVGTQDNPIYESELGTFKQGGNGISRFHQEQKFIHRMIAHSSLDILEDLQWSTTASHFSCFDRFNKLNVSANISQANIKFIMLHDLSNEEGIRAFLLQAQELYLKVALNPFYNTNDVIQIPEFDSKIKALSKKYL